jgi:sialidase-1
MTNNLIRFCCFSLALLTMLPIAAADDQPTASDLFEGGKEGYFAYRIPSLLTTAKGTVLAFCEGRKSSLADLGDNDMLLKRSVDGGRTWGPLQLVYEEGGDKIISIGNPTPVQDRQTGRIWLVFARNSLDILAVHSDDEGETWSEPINFTPQVK